ncbi:hypothetical protein DY000_02005599 [Brassica cretica]|uniref:Uncharacterized protein n=1 Tax=Brassica cretica TaxID=69181 RepID=A0ABQ7BSB1_BRACR|nr:hypothetical protein DY000_02005599 [Brassica cretica]
MWMGPKHLVFTKHTQVCIHSLVVDSRSSVDIVEAWEYIVKGILRNSFTNVWSEILLLITDETREKMSLFCIRYAFQAVLYAVWRERNKIKHGDKLLPLPVLKILIDKGY